VVTCPECGSENLELVETLGGTARRIRCSACGHVWVRGQLPKATREAPLDGDEKPLMVFIDDDEGYMRWVRRHVGYVVNCERRPSPGYLVLHTTDCFHVTTETARMGRAPWTSGDYIKVCSRDRAELNRWANEEVGGELSYCPHCM
jgi:predicted Zn finger-like uncharacterized protein